MSEIVGPTPDLYLDLLEIDRFPRVNPSSRFHRFKNKSGSQRSPSRNTIVWSLSLRVNMTTRGRLAAALIATSRKPGISALIPRVVSVVRLSYIYSLIDIPVCSRIINVSVTTIQSRLLVLFFLVGGCANGETCRRLYVGKERKRKTQI